MESRLAANHYARVLRVIGQDIADLFPVQLEIEQQQRNFIVRARCDRRRSEGKAPPQPAEAPKIGFRSILHKLNTIRLDKAPGKSDWVTVNRAYNPMDISRIDEAGLQRRIQMGKIPDIHNLGEALRTIGRIIDADEGRLTRIFKDQRRVIFDYVVRGGEARKVEMTLTELYKVQQTYYQARSATQTIDLWRGKK